eukprot:gene1406-1775_t
MEPLHRSRSGDSLHSLQSLHVSSGTVIILNIGGKKFTTTVETLRREKDSYFVHLMDELKGEVSKELFIDRDPTHFRYILNYLRDGSVVFPLDYTSQKQLWVEINFYKLESLMNQMANRFQDSTLLNLNQMIKLNEWYFTQTTKQQSNINLCQKWKRIYRALNDGFEAKEFHACVDGKGATYTIIKSTDGYLFGGYLSHSWSSDMKFEVDPRTYLFTLINPHAIPPTRYSLKDTVTNNKINNGNDGPRFGMGDQYCGVAGGNFNFPTSFIDTTGKGNKTFTDSKNFKIYDIEVFVLADE